MNDRFAMLFGYDAKSVVGRKADELIQSRQHLLDQTLADKLINSFGYTTKRSTSIVGFKDGRLFERRIERVTDPKTGEALGLCISYSDITRLQMMLSQKQVDADIAKAERGALLRFLLCTSHDLRMPLQVLSACFDMGPEGFAESVPLGQSAVAMMNMIMCNVLEVHKIEHGDVITNHVSSNFGAELSKLVGLLRVIRNSNIAFVADLAENVPHIIVDAPRLLRVVMNLITNAFKFTKQGSVTLTTKFADLSDGTGRLDVSVRDTGRGMDSATAAACTEMLVSAPADQDGGSGLGLFIVKNVVEEHRGQLRIESQVGVGTTMSFQIVVDIDQTEERPSSSGPSEVGCPPGRCLLVDDTFLIRKILSKLLTDDGHLPTAVASGNEALALLTEQGETFDVCFMDKTMPGLDGPQTVQKYRDWEKEHSDRRMFIAGLTGEACRDDHQLMMDAGCDLVLTKPCSLENLRRVMTDARQANQGASSQPSKLRDIARRQSWTHIKRMWLSFTATHTGPPDAQCCAPFSIPTARSIIT